MKIYSTIGAVLLLTNPNQGFVIKDKTCKDLFAGLNNYNGFTGKWYYDSVINCHTNMVDWVQTSRDAWLVGDWMSECNSMRVRIPDPTDNSNFDG